jgi:hypothetical protein
MFNYSYCGQSIATTTAITELKIFQKTAFYLQVFIEKNNTQEECTSWLHHWLTPNGEPSISYRQEDGSHRLRFPALADFLISPAADRITAYPAPGTPIETTRHLLLDQVLPRCLAHQGQVMLHASAVALPGGVVLFIGSTGQGKSTLAGYFHTQGNEALSDDCVRLVETPQGVNAVPSYGGLRLWHDTLEAIFPNAQDAAPMAHYSSKQRLPLAQSGDPPTAEPLPAGYPLLAVVVLASASDSQAVRLAPLPRRQAFIEMMKQTFLLDVTDRGRYSQLMQAIGRVIPRIKVFSLNLPHDYTLLPLARQMILDAT